MKLFIFYIYHLGLSDPFVIIELIPKNIFPKTSKQQTAVQRATLNPTFDETFEL